MNKEQLLHQVGDLTIWKKGAVRAPHKPLLRKPD
jgi:hypothetical protein